MNEKQDFTAVTSIASANEKLPMQFIAKGETKRADCGFGRLGTIQRRAMKAKKLFRLQFADKDAINVNRDPACALLRQCWGEVSGEALTRAWMVYDPASGRSVS
jgi:hypothetical protein